MLWQRQWLMKSKIHHKSERNRNFRYRNCSNVRPCLKSLDQSLKPSEVYQQTEYVPQKRMCINSPYKSQPWIIESHKWTQQDCNIDWTKDKSIQRHYFQIQNKWFISMLSQYTQRYSLISYTNNSNRTIELYSHSKRKLRLVKSLTKYPSNLFATRSFIEES